MFARHKFLLVCVFGASILTLAGCGADAASQPASSNDGEPNFTGAFAALLTEEYRIAPQGFAQDVLRDGKVNDQERSEAVERFRTCLSENGTTLVKFDDFDGSYTLDVGSEVKTEEGLQDSDSSDQKCYIDSGLSSVDFVYREMKSNPENRDFSEIMVECLLKAKAVPASYSKADFEREYPQDKVAVLRPELTRTSEDPVMICQHDPLGLVAGGK